jgi:hypothetical protein
VIRIPYLRLIRVSRSVHVEFDMDDRLRRIHEEWDVNFDRLAIAHTPPPFGMPRGQRGWWLPRSKQLILIADDLSRATRSLAEKLDGIVGHQDTYLDELSEDVRLIIGTSSGRFYGLRGGSNAVHSSLGLYRCRQCRGAWFLTEWGSWTCRCCGFYDGNAGVLDQFTDVVKLPARWRHAG